MTTAGRLAAIVATLATMLVLALMFLGGDIASGFTDPVDPAVTTVRVAEALLEPQGGPVERRTVPLRHRWDAAFPGRGGRATYTLRLPPSPTALPMALLLERVANQAEVRVNGTTILQLGRPGDPWYDAGKTGQLVMLPTGVLHAAAPNELVVTVTAQPMRFGGLGPVRFGPPDAVGPLQARTQLFDVTLSAAYAAALLLMGGLAAALWWRQRDPLYGIFCLAALFGIVRHLDRIWIGTMLPWPLAGAVQAIFYVLHLTLVGHFSVLILRQDLRWLARAIQGVMITGTLLAALSFWLVVPWLWTAALTLQLALGATCLAIVAREAWRTRAPIALGLALTLTLLVAAGVHDLLILRLGYLGGGSIGLTPHFMMTLVALLAGLVAARYSRSVAAFESLNANLADRIAEREAQLRDAFETLRGQAQSQAVAEERQRIMREIHDGIGSQLVGLLNLLDHEPVDRAAIEREIRTALDEMRMAVDSLQPMDSDLSVVLATLRYRLQPRLEAARLAVTWDVGELPLIPELSPPTIFQLQRILLEALTNVLRHARATRVRIHAHWRADGLGGVVLGVTDDGVGPGPAGAGGRTLGQGVASMRARAEAIGATLHLDAAPGGGTAVVIDWPVAGRNPAPTSAADLAAA